MNDLGIWAGLVVDRPAKKPTMPSAEFKAQREREDAELAERVRAFVDANPEATRQQIIKHTKSSTYRLETLHKKGLIEFPAPISASVAGMRSGARRAK